MALSLQSVTSMKHCLSDVIISLVLGIGLGIIRIKTLAGTHLWNICSIVNIFMYVILNSQHSFVGLEIL